MSLLAALRFLTRVPIPGAAHDSPSTIACTQSWFPIVGLLIGLALVGVDRTAMRALPQASVDALIVVTLIVLTGALHLDGLADAADGLFGGNDAKSRLAIMHDVHIGTYGVIAIVAVLALKWAGLNALPGAARVEALLLVPCLARFALLIAIAAFPYARAEGTGKVLHEVAWPRHALVGGATALVAAVLLLGVGGVYPFIFAAACAIAVGLLATRLAGGMTGDVYGATVEVTEALAWLFFAALANRGWIDAFAFG
jgi:adenosylcobinamide-GDP ribazoletransferase